MNLKTRFLLFFFFSIFILNDSYSQEESRPPQYFLKTKDGSRIKGFLLDMNKDRVIFLMNRDTINFNREEVVSLLKVSEETASQKDTNPEWDIKSLMEKFPGLYIDPNIRLWNKSQTHLLVTKRGEHYLGKIAYASEKELIFARSGDYRDRFVYENISRIEVNKDRSIKLSQPDIKDNTEILSRRENRVPNRIFLTHLALPKVKGQTEYRNSNVYFNEFTFSAANYLSLSAGAFWFDIMLKMQAVIPLSENFNIGMGGQVLSDAIYRSESNEWVGSYFANITIGNPDRFINLGYHSKTKAFIYTFDNGLTLPRANNFNFGSGLKLFKNFHFLTESILYLDENSLRHFKVNLGATFQVRRHSFGLGYSYVDSNQSINNGPNIFTGFYEARF